MEEPLDRDGVEVARRLETLASQRPNLAEATAYYSHLLPLFRSTALELALAPLSREKAQRKLSQGVPLLVGEKLEIEPVAARGFFVRLCEVTGDFSSDAQKRVALERIRTATLSEAFDLVRLSSTAASDQVRAVAEAATRLGLDEALLGLLVQNTLKPPLRAFRRCYQQQVDLEDWRRSICPFCGRAPALAELQGVQRAGHLRCGVCGGDWPYPRLQCGLCENDNYRTLGTIGLENDRDRAYAQACERCRGYLKTIVSFDPTPVHLLEVQDLETISLDWAATRLGYSRPAS